MADRPEREHEIESHLRATEVAEHVEPDQLDDDAIDFSQVHADDAFLDALGATKPDPSGMFADDRLAELLLAWRSDVDAEPITELVDPKLAVATVQAARIRARRGSRLLAPLAAAAAVLAIVFAGVGLAARDAQPGDTLWGLTRVLYADHARSVEAAQAVRVDLSEAEQALASGRVAEAKSMLDQAQSTLPTVASEDGQADLQAKHAELLAKLPDNPVEGASPPPSASPTTAPATDSTDPTTDPVDSSTVQPPPTTDPTTTTPPTTTTETGSEPGRVETEPTSPKTETNSNPAGEPASEPAGGTP
ncbi:MAG TPA: anti-sigma-D factor RsdA [Actinophytocola sp.]|uniref:anti-sigma-D factor RsdA n=1 Tax=Actinophytocola sp. TaxID=1872138 RepID=UPI002DDCA540|nr:anti-sigma-D factor RsdA [Actinophytocola sp.]HEV2781428.1 anti-sigma-D factor RsdA [Actinophytocola sp.]